MVRLCCCLKRTARPIGRDTILSPVGLTCFLLSDGDEGQGTALLLTPPACARTRGDYAWKENGFAFVKANSTCLYFAVRTHFTVITSLGYLAVTGLSS